ncbi:short-chain dehydrogenase/reductase family protein [Cavenderia fasciculata]|uniref:Short-chain dehydrogenase/reductase family protein n=1 Tax=Cavenderia fasciculata TaxID=261658 RepID=F4Q6Z2_CACFS|nr:short-chain dehydrogenase/reductase family protein [Cavenderia fasciculata]EGG16174.1 short-chain dehydrogenase/reductase family protein [Cavenderia fasciculata]|eukprot:XP_004352627.1 short-chain dehydrogenase/reductase family protein [Cavenderia fasciculata]
MEGKVIVVTGAGSGIGRSVCLELVGQKAKVVVADINFESCQETIKLMTELDAAVETVAVACDISSEEDVTRLMQSTVDKFGRIDGAVNNAGILGKMQRVGDYELADFTKMLDVNVKGTFMCIRSQVRQMEKQGPGKYSIVNVSSIAGILGFPYNSAYSCVKHAILGLTKSTAAEYGAALGVRCNAMLPGAADTPMLRQYIPTDAAAQQLKAHTPLGRTCEPSEIAKPIVFLLSEQSSFVTGQNLIADGGLSIV